MTPVSVRRSTVRVGVLLALFSCGDSSSAPADEAALEGETTCEQHASLAARKGCAAAAGCVLAAECDELGKAWLACVAQDLSQCLCEGDDGKLNCEGSFKPNEGPARCRTEYGAFNSCQEQADPRDDLVGEACLPEQVPETGFTDTEAYVEADSAQCAGDACLVYRLAGDPRAGCVPTQEKPCAAPGDVAERVYCTCRCDAGDTGFEECECPDGFTCVSILEQGGPSVAGGYCVRNAP